MFGRQVDQLEIGLGGRLRDRHRKDDALAHARDLSEAHERRTVFQENAEETRVVLSGRSARHAQADETRRAETRQSLQQVERVRGPSNRVKRRRC
jgi:hypothetical protein